MIIFTFTLILIIFLGLSFFILINLSKDKPEAGIKMLHVSVVIPARNEEENIEDLLNSLTKIDYPEKLSEFIIAVDRSYDRTLEIVKTFKNRIKNLKIINITDKPSGVSGKSNALDIAVKNSSGRIILFTDADCTLNPNWINQMVLNISDNHTIAAGFLHTDKKEDKKFNTLFSKLQTIDWIRFCTAGKVFAEKYKPLSIFGNNFAVSKTLYDSAGGFKHTGTHPTEDYAFMKNAVNKKNARVIFSLSRNSLVFTKPEPNLKSFFNQRLRWALGTKNRDRISLLLLSIPVVIFLASLFLLFTEFKAFGFAGFAALILSDLLLIIKPLKILKKLYLLKYLPVYEIYFICYIFLTSVLLLFKKNILWKKDVV